MLTCGIVAIKITFFTAFKVTNYAEEFCRGFRRFCVRNHSANILTEKTPKSFPQKSIKNCQHNFIIIIFVIKTIMICWWKFKGVFHKRSEVLKIGHFFCPFLIFGNTFDPRNFQYFL